MTHISHIEHSLEMRGPRKRAPHIWQAVCNMLSACLSFQETPRATGRCEYEDSELLKPDREKE